jgi:hypothetical protein
MFFFWIPSRKPRPDRPRSDGKQKTGISNDGLGCPSYLLIYERPLFLFFWCMKYFTQNGNKLHKKMVISYTFPVFCLSRPLLEAGTRNDIA